MNPSQLDREVVEACQRGDREAFRLVFEAYQDKIYSMALYFFGGDEAAASDATQQVFLKLFSKIGQFRYGAQFSTWFYRLAVNVCVDERRRTRRLVPLAEGLSSKMRTAGKTQDELYMEHELESAVRLAIGELKPKLRLPILLKYLEGLSYEEIASVVGCSKGTVASRLNRGHQILARRLVHLRGAYAAGD